MDAEAWDARYGATELVWSVTPNRFVEQQTADLPPGRALDLAAGEGRNALWLASRGWTVTALDFSAVGLDKGRVRADADGLSLDWVCADATSYAPGPVFDLVVLAYLQLPASGRRQAVRAAFSALAPGGRLVVVAHDSSNLTEGTGGPQDATVLYTADDVLGDLAGELFRVVHADRVARPVPAGDGHGGEPDTTAWDALVHVVRDA